MTLKELETGKSAVIRTVGGKGALRQHFLDMGMIPGAEVTVVKLAPMGDPMELQVHGYELTLRLAERSGWRRQIRLRLRRSIREQGATPAVNGCRQQSIRDLVRKENIILRRMRIRCRRGHCSPMLLSAIRIVEKRHCLTSLPDRTNMSVIFRVLRWIVRMERSKDMQRQILRIFRAFIPCRHTAARRSYQGILCWMRSRGH